MGGAGRRTRVLQSNGGGEHVYSRSYCKAPGSSSGFPRAATPGAQAGAALRAGSQGEAAAKEGGEAPPPATPTSGKGRQRGGGRAASGPPPSNGTRIGKGSPLPPRSDPGSALGAPGRGESAGHHGNQRGGELGRDTPPAFLATRTPPQCWPRRAGQSERRCPALQVGATPGVPGAPGLPPVRPAPPPAPGLALASRFPLHQLSPYR